MFALNIIGIVTFIIIFAILVTIFIMNVCSLMGDKEDTYYKVFTDKD